RRGGVAEGHAPRSPASRSTVHNGTSVPVHSWHLPDLHTLSGMTPSGRAAESSTTWLASAGIDGVVRLWNPITDHEWGDGLYTGISIWAMAAVPSTAGGPLLACGGVEGTIQLWDPVLGRCTKMINGHQNTVHAITSVPIAGGEALLVSA